MLGITTAAAGMPNVPADGPGVRRDVVPVDQLVARAPELAGRLAPPPMIRPHGSYSVRGAADGVRIMTINVHEGVPGGIEMTGANQSIEALRDVARAIRFADPDVVLVQELTRRRHGSFGDDLEEQPSILAHLVEADDMAFTPAFNVGWGEGETGTAVYTRNGFTIELAVNVALPDGAATQPRGAAVASVRAPDGGPRLTVIGTHLAHRAEDRESRGDQLAELAAIADDVAHDGSFEYTPRIPDGFRWPWQSGAAAATGFATDRIVLAGDLNATQAESSARGNVDDILGRAGLVNAIDLLARTGNPEDAARAAEVAGERTTSRRRIDHVYAAGMHASDVRILAVPNVELRGDAPPTDHRAVIADLR
jgi:endonuclease/exonuclease/phosphatase family metal-dependent hydrolase